MNTGSLRNRSFWCVHFSVFRHICPKNTFTGPKSFRGFRESGPWSEINSPKCFESDVYNCLLRRFVFYCTMRLGVLYYSAITQQETPSLTVYYKMLSNLLKTFCSFRSWARP